MKAEGLIKSRDIDSRHERIPHLRSTDVWGRPATLIARSEPKRAQAKATSTDGTYECFRSEARFYCRETGCKFRTECIRLVAAWKS